MARRKGRRQKTVADVLTEAGLGEFVKSQKGLGKKLEGIHVEDKAPSRTQTTTQVSRRTGRTQKVRPSRGRRSRYGRTGTTGFDDLIASVRAAGKAIDPITLRTPKLTAADPDLDESPKARLTRARQYAKTHGLPEPRLTKSGNVEFDPGAWQKLAPRAEMSLLSGVPYVGKPLDKYGGLAAEQLAEAAIYSPAGIAELVKRGGQDWYDVARASPYGMALRAAGVDLGEGDILPTRTAKLIKEMGKSTYMDFRHPGRYPGFLLLDVLAALSLGAGAGARGLAAGRIARTGEVYRGGEMVATNRATGAAKALIRREPTANRFLTVDDFTTQATYSRNPAFEVAQRAHDRLMKRWINGRDTFLKERARNHMLRRVRVEEAANQRVRLALEQAEAKKLAAQVLTPQQQLALRMYAENVPPAQVVAYHEAQALTGTKGEKVGHKLRALNARKAAKYLEVDAKGDVQFAKHRRKQRLERMYRDMEAVSEGSTELGYMLDLLTPEAAEMRIHGPGRIYRGASHVEPTPSRMGWETAATRVKRLRVQRLEKRYNAALEKAQGRAKQAYVGIKDGEEFPLDNPYKPPTTLDRARTPEEAGKRLKKLLKMWDDLLEARMQQLMPKSERSAEALRRSAHNRKLKAMREAGESGQRRLDPGVGKGRRVDEEALAETGAWSYVEGSEPVPYEFTIKEELRQDATAFLLGAAEGQSPEAGKLRAMLDEMDELERALGEAQASKMSETERAIFLEDAGEPRWEVQSTAGEVLEVFPGTPEGKGAANVALSRHGFNNHVVYVPRKTIGRRGEPIEPSLGTVPGEGQVVPTDMPPRIQVPGSPSESIYTPTVQRLGGALSVARDELAAAERAALNRVEQTGIVEGAAVRNAMRKANQLATKLDRATKEGDFQAVHELGQQLEAISIQIEQLMALEGGGRLGRIRVPYSIRSVRIPRNFGMARSKLVAEGKAPRTLVEPFRGRVIEKYGGGRIDTTRLVADDFIERSQYKARLEFVARLRDASHPGERLPGDIAIRLINPRTLKPHGAEAPGGLSSAVESILAKSDDVKLTKEDRKALRKDIEEFESYLFPEGAAVQDLVDKGEVGWVNEKLLAYTNAPTHVPGNIIKAWDTLNNYAKLRLIYLKVGYIPPNFLGNFLLNTIQQGFLALPNLGNAARMSRDIGGRYTGIIDSGVGRGVARALTQPGEGGPLEALTQRVADLVSWPTDVFTRRSSFYYEASRKGYKTVREIRRLLDDPNLEADRIDVFRRARENAIEYERLTPVEKNYVRRIIFIYPWVKGSTVYLGHFLRDHPVLAAGMAHLGVWGKEHNPLADISPSFMKGVFPTSKIRDDGTFEFVDPRGAAVAQTPVDVFSTAAGAIKGEFQQNLKPSEWMTVPGQLLLAYLSQTGTRGPFSAAVTGPVEAFKQFEESTPQHGWFTEDATGMVTRSPWQRLGRAMAGGLAPSTGNLSEWEAKHEEDVRARLTPVQRKLRTQTRWRMDTLEAAKKYGLVSPTATQLPDKIREAAKHWSGRQTTYVALGIDKLHGLEYQKAAFKADISILRRRGELTPKRVRRAMKWLETASANQIEDSRTKMSDDYFGREAIRMTMTELERAAFKDELESLAAEGKITNERAAEGMQWANTASLRSLQASREASANKYGYPYEKFRDLVR